MAHIVGISGSLRRHSFNRGLLHAAARLMPEGSRLTIVSIADVPLYNADVEVETGIPAAVTALKDAVAAGDALLLATPEYNNGIPGVFKNAIDWMSRPADDIGRVFGGKPVTLIGASPGGFGTLLAQDSWLSVLRTLGTRPGFEGRLLVSRAGGLFDDRGALADEQTMERLRAFLSGFVAYIEGQGR